MALLSSTQAAHSFQQWTTQNNTVMTVLGLGQLCWEEQACPEFASLSSDGAGLGKHTTNSTPGKKFFTQSKQHPQKQGVRRGVSCVHPLSGAECLGGRSAWRKEGRAAGCLVLGVN